MSEQLERTILDRIQQKWESKWTLALTLTVAAAVSLGLFAQFKIEEISTLEWLATIVVLMAIFVVWLVTNRVPKHSAEKVGFGIAISCGDEEQWRLLKEDFIDMLRRLLQEKNSHRFDLIVHNQRVSKTVDSSDAAIELARKSNACFLIYGSAKVRQLDGKEHHVIRLNCVIAHEQVPEQVTKAFALESSVVLPRDIRLPKEEGMEALELTAGLVDLCSRYIIGTAAMISGDYDYSLSLFHGLEQKAPNTCFANSIQIQKIKKNLPDRISAVHQHKVNVLAEFYRLKRDNSWLAKIDEELRILAKLSPGWYKGHLLRAMCAFVLRRDLPSAWREVKACANVADTTWRYTEAFLHAYEGKLNLAWRSYQIGFEKPSVDPTVPLQAEEFIQIVLNEEPEKTQLHFCLGLINWKAKSDIVAAKADFGQFLGSTSEERYPRQHKLAKRWLENDFQSELAEV